MDRAHDLVFEVANNRVPPLIMAQQVRDEVERLREINAALLAALRAILFQVIQGKVLERDACISQARAAIAQAEGK